MKGKFHFSRLFSKKLKGGKVDKYNVLTKYFILILLGITAVEIFLDSEKVFATGYKNLFFFIDIFITIVFSVEVVIRIRYCGEIDTKYAGKRGRIKYLYSFENLVDLFSILPFFFYLIFPIGLLLAISRIFRILKIFRYITSFQLITNAIKNKTSELIISLQVVVILTFLLAVMLFLVEHKAQADVFQSIWSSIKWAVGKYIDGIGGYGEYAPITVTGKILATLVGFMGIALIAVPAGIIASGFVDEMQKVKKDIEIREKIKLLEDSFRPSKNSKLNIPVEPRIRSLTTIQTRLLITQDEIIEAVRNAENLRLKWTKSDEDIRNFDMLIVEHFPKNTEYGYKRLNNKSNVFIINPIGRGEQGFSHFTRCLAESIDANYLTNEIFSSADVLDNHHCSFSANDAYIKDDINVPNAFHQFKRDIKHNIKKNDWVFIFSSATSIYENQFHLLFGGQKGQEGFDFPNRTINDIDNFKNFYSDFKKDATEILKYNVGTHEKYSRTDKRDLHQYIWDTTGANVVTIFISIKVVAYNQDNYYESIRVLNDKIATWLSLPKLDNQ